MKKTPRLKDAITVTSEPESPQPVCWERDPNAQALRVELNDGSVFIFPYAHLSFAKLTRDAAAETLKLVFSTHEVNIAGRKLREVSIAVQKLSVDWIKEIPARYAQLAEHDTAFIETITVKGVAVEHAVGETLVDDE